ncbi:hypothetical protein LJR044_002510 [Microbacterium foliorum]
MGLVYLGSVDAASDGTMASVTNKVNSLFRGALTDLIEVVLSDNPTIVAGAQAAAVAAVDAALAEGIATQRLVRFTDPAIPQVDPALQSSLAVFFLNAARQLLGGFTESGLLRFQGIELPDGSVTQSLESPEYSRLSVGSNRRVGEDALGPDGNTPAWIINRWLARVGFGGNLPSVTLVVRPNPGPGEYASPKLAHDAITDSSAAKRYLILVYPGAYTETEWTLKPFTTTVGVGVYGSVILRGELPDSATDAQIQGTSTVWFKDTARIENIVITARNMRYAVHSESSGAIVDYLHEMSGCHVEHFGNDGARAWRTANPGSGMSPSTVWASDRAWGYGASSGGRERHENTTFVSRLDAWYVHDNADWSKPANHELINCRIIATDPAGRLRVEPLGSGQTSRVIVRASVNDFLYVNEADTPWISTALANQVANHSQILVTVEGLGPIGFLTSARGKALRIESASSGASSSVRLSGTAAAAIVGRVFTRDGGGGLKGEAWGEFDISGILVGPAGTTQVANTLGRRLGDCTTVNKTLTVTVDGGAPVNVVFTGNHTADSNATILALINAALGSAATASEYSVSQGETYPTFPDREVTVRNDGTAGIPRFAAVRTSPVTGRAIRIHGTADPVSVFAGIALEPIAPGKTGRVLKSGLLNTPTQLYGYASGLAVGAPLYLSDSTAGAFSATGTRQVLVGHHTDWARF